MSVRIEVYERYLLDSDIDYEGMGMKVPPTEYGYRRTMPMVDTIERPIEIEDNDSELILRFFSGEDMVIRDNYDEFCIKLNDIEMETLINDIIDEIQIEKEDV